MTTISRERAICMFYHRDYDKIKAGELISAIEKLDLEICYKDDLCKSFLLYTNSIKADPYNYQENALCFRLFIDKLFDASDALNFALHFTNGDCRCGRFSSLITKNGYRECFKEDYMYCLSILDNIPNYSHCQTAEIE